MLHNPPEPLSSPPPDKMVTVHTLAHKPESSRVRYSGVRSKGAGWLLVIGGCSTVLLGALLLWACSLAGVAGAGFWGGMFYIIAGALGICAGKKKTKGYISGFFIMSIIAIIVGFGVIAVTAVALALSNSTGTYYCQSYSAFDTRGTVMECLLLIVAILLFFLLIWAVKLSGPMVCFGKMVMEQPQLASEVKYSEPQDMILTSSRATSPWQKSAPPSANTTREHFQFPPPKELQYSHDGSQSMTQYSENNTSNSQHQTLQYSHYPQYSQGAPVQYSGQPYVAAAPNTPQYAAPPPPTQRQYSQNSQQYSQNTVPQFNNHPQYPQQGAARNSRI